MNMHTLLFPTLLFNSQLDKDLMMARLESISSIESHIQGNKELQINLLSTVSNEDLLDLAAFCDRFELPIDQLQQFINEENRYWSFGPKFQVIYPHSNQAEKEKLDTDSGLVRIDCAPIDLYTQLDKHIMFEWMERIASVKHIVGVGPVLYLYLDSKKITDQDIIELTGLFSRYKFDMAQLDALKHATN